MFFLFFLLLPPPPCSPLFPYTTLFRSPFSSSPLPFPGSSFCAGRTSSPRATWIFSSPVRSPSPPGRTSISRSPSRTRTRSEEHTSELQSRQYLVCRLLLEKKKKKQNKI